MAPSAQLAALVSQMPEPDRGGILGTADKQAIEKALAEIRKGGRDNFIGLVDLLVEPGQGSDSQARYAIHALAIHASGARDDAQRRVFTEALASTLGSARPKAVQVFVMQQLQLAGGKEAAFALGKLLLDDDLCDAAAAALLAIKEGAAEQLRAALPKAAGKSRLTIVQGLGVVRDGSAAEQLRKLVGDPDRDTRLAAGWALANMGDPGSVDLLLKASATAGYERIKATQSCLLLAEKLQAAGQKKDAARIWTHLRDTRTNPSERHIRDAATRALAAAGL